MTVKSRLTIGLIVAVIGLSAASAINITQNKSIPAINESEPQVSTIKAVYDYALESANFNAECIFSDMFWNNINASNKAVYYSIEKRLAAEYPPGIVEKAMKNMDWLLVLGG